jgi:hypothetical protein
MPAGIEKYNSCARSTADVYPHNNSIQCNFSLIYLLSSTGGGVTASANSNNSLKTNTMTNKIKGKRNQLSLSNLP